MINLYKKAAILLVFCLISLGSFSQCMQVPVTLSERVSSSNIVFEGRVLSKTSAWSNVKGKRIVTYNTVKVYKVFKGNISSSTVEVVTKGGTVGTDMLVVSPSLQLNVGDVGVFTLEPGYHDQSTLVAYAEDQGFIKYNEANNTAKSLFDNYKTLSDLHTSIEDITNIQPQEIIHYNGAPSATNKMATPSITSLSPTSINAGTYELLTITGSNFGSTAGSINFPDADDGGASYITATSSLIQSWSNTSITVYVPSGATSGNVQVTNTDPATGTSAATISVGYNISAVTNDFVYGTDHDVTADLVNDNGTGALTFTFNNSYYANTNAVDRFDEVIYQWKCETGINWRSNGASTTTIDQSTSDGTNIVVFDDNDALSSGTLGQCASYYSACSSGGAAYWHVTELDVIFNDNSYTWNYTSAAPSGGEYDFYSVMLHEIGHGHQLGHVSATSDVMYYSIGAGTQKRSISADNSTAGNYVMTRSNTNESSYCGHTGGSTVNNVCGTDAMISDYCNAVPTAAFSADNVGTCSSSLTSNFTDASLGVPTSWSWDFGDGGSSTSENPSHTYSAAGTYTVTLTVTNGAGNDSEIKTGYISIGGSTATSSCSVTTTNAGAFGTGIDQVDFNTISNAHTDNDNDGTQDFTCTNITYVDPGSSYNLTVTGAGGNNEYCRVYIDYNDDGLYTAGEIVYNEMSIRAASHSTSVTIPSTPDVTGEVIRMRVMTDFNTFSSGCPGALTYGEVEDYGIFINTPAGNAPAASFSAAATTVCNGASTVFTDASTETPTSWAWTFTPNTVTYINSTSATSQNPDVQFDAAGTYQVQLTATNATGSDDEIKASYITVSALPDAAGAITGNASVCGGGTGVTYSISAVTNATGYNWTLPTGTSITSGSGTNSITVTMGTNSGTVEVTPTNSCGNGTASNTAVTVTNAPSAAGAITGSTSECENATGITYSISAVTGATGYNWTLPTGASITAGSGTNSITVSFGTSSGTVEVTPTNACGNGTASNTTVTLTTSVGNAGAITGSTSECENATDITYSISAVTGATNYTWSVPSGASVASGQGTTSITVNFGSTSGNVTVIPSNSCGNGVGAQKVVTINSCISPTINNVFCGNTITSEAQYIFATNITNATDYEFQLVPQGGGTTINYVNPNGNYMTFLWLSSWEYNTTYDVSVRAKINGTYTAYGASCEITSPSVSAKHSYNNEDIESIYSKNSNSLSSNSKFNVYPNPSHGEFVYLEIEEITSNTQLIVSNIYGETILNQMINNGNETIRFENKLTPGLYMVTVISDNNQTTKKLIVR